MIELIKLRCKQCLHEWIPRVSEVRWCPKCLSIYWDRDEGPRKYEKTGKFVGRGLRKAVTKSDENS